MGEKKGGQIRTEGGGGVGSLKRMGPTAAPDSFLRDGWPTCGKGPKTDLVLLSRDRHSMAKAAGKRGEGKLSDQKSQRNYRVPVAKRFNIEAKRGFSYPQSERLQALGGGFPSRRGTLCRN